jgi:cation transport ATPase
MPLAPTDRPSPPDVDLLDPGAERDPRLVVVDARSVGATEDAGPAGRSGDEERWWERGRLTAAAAGCWLLLVLAAGFDRLTGAPHGLVLALYAGAYLAGGTFAARAAIGDLFHGRVNVDLLMVTAAIGAAFVDAWGVGAILL